MLKIRTNKNIKWIFITSVFIGLYIVLSISLFTHESFQHWLLSFSPDDIFTSSVILLLLCGLSSLGLPRQVTAFTCGYFFHLYYGVVLATCAVTVGAYITFTIASLFKAHPILLKYNIEVTKLSSFLSTRTFTKTLIIRLLPVGSNFLTNILAGVAGTPIKPYLAGSFIGYIPQMVIFSLAGTGVKLAATQHIVTSVALFIVALFLGWILYKKNNKIPVIKKSD